MGQDLRQEKRSNMYNWQQRKENCFFFSTKLRLVWFYAFCTRILCEKETNLEKIKNFKKWQKCRKQIKEMRKSSSQRLAEDNVLYHVKIHEADVHDGGMRWKQRSHMHGITFEANKRTNYLKSKTRVSETRWREMNTRAHFDFLICWLFRYSTFHILRSELLLFFCVSWNCLESVQWQYEKWMWMIVVHICGCVRVFSGIVDENVVCLVLY